MNEEIRDNGLARVAAYISNLKFKKAMVGGVDQEDALNSMRELTQIFTTVYNKVVMENESLSEQLEEAKRTIADLSQGVPVPSAPQGSNEELERLQGEVDQLHALLEQKDEAIAAAEGARDSLMEQLAARTAEAAADADNSSRMVEEKVEAARAQRDAALADAEEARKESDAAKEALENANAEIQNLRSQVRDLRQTRQFEDSDRETLEEIYLSANRRRNEILSEAQSKADAIRTEMEQTRNELELALSQREQEAQQKIEEQEAEAQARFQKSQEDSETLLSDARAMGEQLRQEAEEEAQNTVNEAHVLAGEIVKKAEDEAAATREQTEAYLVAAGDKYRAERARYEEMLGRLGDMRKAVLNDIRADIDNLQKVAFDMTTRSLERESDSSVLLNNLDEEEKDHNQ